MLMLQCVPGCTCGCVRLWKVFYPLAGITLQVKHDLYALVEETDAAASNTCHRSAVACTTQYERDGGKVQRSCA